MFDNLLFTELIAQSRRDEIEEAIRHDHDISVIGRRDPRFSVRGTLASALLRLAMLVDANAGRRAATSVGPVIQAPLPSQRRGGS